MNPIFRNGLAAFQAGDLAAAEPLLRAVPADALEHLDAKQLLAQIRLVNGDAVGAAAEFDALASALDHVPGFHINRALAHETAQSLTVARQHYTAVLDRFGDHPTALFRLAKLSSAKDALTLLRRLKLDPMPFEALLAVAEAERTETGQTDWAAATDAAGNKVDQLNLVGEAQFRLGDIDAARATLERCLQLDPDHMPAMSNLGLLFASNGAAARALKLLSRAHELAPDLPATALNLAHAHREIGDAAAAMAVLNTAAETTPTLAILSGRAFTCLHLAPYDGPAHLEVAQQWSRLLPAPPPRPEPRSADPERRLKLGYISPDFRRHPAWDCWADIIPGHDPASFEVELFYTHIIQDEVTQKWRGMGKAFHHIAHLSPGEKAEAIRRAGIDVLIDMGAGHTGRNALEVFHHRPAPIQIINAPATSGTSVFDSFPLPAAFQGETADIFTEPTPRQPGAQYLYRPRDTMFEPGPPPVVKNGFITFASFAKLTKLSDEAMSAMAATLRAVPNSRFLLKSRMLEEPATAEIIRQRFLRFGMPEDRLQLVGFLPDDGFEALFKEVDIALDSYPYTGTVTNFEFLFNGIPIVTRRGRHLQAQWGSICLNTIGIDGLIAHDEESYVRIAADLAQDIPRLTHLRANLRGKMQASPLMHPKIVIEGYEAHYRDLWRRLCAGELS